MPPTLWAAFGKRTVAFRQLRVTYAHPVRSVSARQGRRQRNRARTARSLIRNRILFWTPLCSGKGIAFKMQVCYDKITRSTVRKSIPYRKKKSPAIAWKAGGSVFLYGSGKVPSQGISSLWMSSSQKESSAELPQATLKLASCWLSPKLSARREPFRAFSAFAATWAELSAPS